LRGIPVALIQEMTPDSESISRSRGIVVVLLSALLTAVGVGGNYILFNQVLPGVIAPFTEDSSPFSAASAQP